MRFLTRKLRRTTRSMHWSDVQMKHDIQVLQP